MEFKIGDKVIIKNIVAPVRFKRKIGEVIKIEKAVDTFYLIQFDEGTWWTLEHRMKLAIPKHICNGLILCDKCIKNSREVISF